MNIYLDEVFKQISENQNVFLLNGPSVAELENKINKLKDKKVLYWGINNSVPNEKNILSKINRDFDFWIVNHAFAESNPNLIYEFLERNTSKALFITADVLITIRPYFCSRMPKNIHKIYIVNTQPIEWREGARLYDTEYYNTLLVLLYFYISISYNSNYNLYIFGMDGAKLSDEQTHAYNAVSKLRISRNQVESLYNDQLQFDKIHSQNLQKLFGKNCFEKTINANINSHYNSLKKENQDDCITNIFCNTENGFIKNPNHNFSTEEQILIYNSIKKSILESDHFIKIFFEQREYYALVWQINSDLIKLNEKYSGVLQIMESKLCQINSDLINLNEKYSGILQIMESEMKLKKTSFIRKIKDSITKKLI